MIEVTLLCQGRFNDDLGIQQGCFDGELTAVGRTQVARLITRSTLTRWQRKGHSFDRIVSSPLALSARLEAVLGLLSVSAAAIGLELLILR